MRRTSPGAFLASLAALLALLVVSFAGPRVARADDELNEVPDVAGKSLADAQAALTGAGFVVATVEVDGVPEDTVAAQAPAATSLLPRTATVVIDVRKKGTPGTAPKVTGMTTVEASNGFGSLYDLEFQPVPGGAADRGRVVGQTPTMGAPLALRGRLTLSFVPDPALPPTSSVPTVTHLPPADAIQAVANAGLHARVAKISLPGVPEGLIVSQVPTAGTEMPRYGTVVVVISAPSEAPSGGVGAAVVAVPNLLGLTEGAARAAVEGAGLDLEVAWVDGPPADAFLVRTQSPEANASAETGSAVKVEIVKYAPPEPVAPETPPTQVSCPELVGLTQAQAEALLASLGLVGNPILEATNDVPPLRVFAQQIIPGTMLDVGTQLAFRVAKPLPPPVATPVPNFFNRTKGDALVLAAQAGLSISIVEVVTPSHPPHRVYSQNIAAFSNVPLGTVVTVKLARPPAGPALVPVPELDGLFAAQAMAKLASVGLAGNAIEVATNNHPPFKVYSQAPAAGVPWPVGGTVSFKVAKPVIVQKVVPPLLGLTKAQATAAVVAAGLQPSAVEVFALGKPVGKVFEQSHAPGTPLPPGAVVGFKVSKPLLVAVPPVLGKTTAQAIAILQGAGLLADVKIVPAFGKPPGIVFDQNPAAGASVAPNTTVTIKVPPGFGPQVLVPDLTNFTKAAAIAALNAKGLQSTIVEVVALQPSWGKVVSQTPVGGQMVAAGANIILRIGKGFVGPVNVMVPNVVGFTQAAAKAALEGKGFVVDVDLVASLQPAGKVFDQSPNVGIFRPAGSTVQIRVATPLAPQMVVVPLLGGKTPAQAQAALLAAGLASQGSAFIKIGKPHGLVYWQNQAGGTLIAKGSTIHWRWNP